MTLPLDAQYRNAFDHALAAALAGIDTADEAEAAVEVAEAVKAATAASQQAAVLAVTQEAKRRAREAEQAARRATADTERRKQIASDGAKAIAKVFGRKTAAKVSVFQHYTICTVHDVVLAVPSDQLDDFRERLMRELRTRPEEDKSAPATSSRRSSSPATWTPS
jgi:hypothetical protein